ncbi:MAG: PRC-barrel domain-containing protein [Alphaproteobacteria bacterium]
MPRTTSRKITLADKLVGFAAVAAVGLPMTALAQAQMPERAPGDNPMTTPGDRPMPAPRSDMPNAGPEAMPDPRGAMPGAADQSANRATEPVDTLSAMHSDDIIGANVRNSANEVVGKVDSLLLTKDGRVVAAIVDVGGFLGIGARQVAVPMEQISMIDGGNVSLPSATKESLKAAPAYEKPSARR